MRIELSLTKAEVKALQRRDVRYRVVAGAATPEDCGPTIDWADGVVKSKARQSAERKLLAALSGDLPVEGSE